MHHVSSRLNEVSSGWYLRPQQGGKRPKQGQLKRALNAAAWQITRLAHLSVRHQRGKTLLLGCTLHHATYSMFSIQLEVHQSLTQLPPRRF
jgi:hypothetical protein